MFWYSFRLSLLFVELLAVVVAVVVIVVFVVVFAAAAAVVTDLFESDEDASGWFLFNGSGFFTKISVFAELWPAVG
jgi:hypothetical protein